MYRLPAALRRLTLVLTAIFGFMTLAVPAAQAGFISAERYAAPHSIESQRDELRLFLQRAEVRAQLIALGVQPEAAQSRIDALSAAELQRALRLAEQPAGGSAAGAIALIFVVLLITDLLGLTDVFTFVRK